MKFANRVRELRLQKGYTREELAQHVGVTRQSIGLIEAGKVCPSAVIALRLSRVLNCAFEVLFWEQEETVQAKLVLEDADDLANLDGPIRAYMTSIRGEVIARPARVESVESISAPAHGIVERAAPSALSEARLLQSPESILKTVFVSGCDIGLGLLANYTQAISPTYRGIWFNVSNQRALRELEDGVTHVAAVHYSANKPSFANSEMTVSSKKYHFATAELGWMVKRGNPLGFQGAEDLSSGRLRLINREMGSGARGLLDAELQRAEVSAAGVTGYISVAKGHAAVAEAVATGLADVGVGHAGAAAIYGLAFIPIQTEFCALVVPTEYEGVESVQVLLDALHSDVFRMELGSFGPYDVEKTGTVIA